nr:T9SS type A sorting domain-containing protein [Bacteroidota bacterium]
LNAQVVAGDDKVAMIKLENFGVSKPLVELANSNPQEFESEEKEISKDREKRQVQTFVYSADKDGAAYSTDPSSVQKDAGTRTPLPPIANWQGQTGGGCPPDPSGAAGPNHYIQAVNATPVRIYNKTGTPLVAAFNMGNLWSPTVANLGDPIVMYDKYADRWFLSQFGSGNKIYIAISTSPDPLGTWYTYTYTASSFPDYLKFSIWWDGYYMTANYGGKIMVFERDKMLLGLTARGFEKTFSPTFPSGFFCPMPGDADGGLPSSGTPLPVFQYTDNGWGGGATDAIKIFNFTVNWTPTTPTATVAATITIPTLSAFDSSYDPSWNDIWTPGSTGKLDGIGGVLHYRVQWRKWVGYNTAVMSWGVKLDPTSKRRSIKWVELRQNQTTLAWSVYQEGVYAPADGANRWMESIAMDDNGSIALAYCISASTTASPTQGATANISPSLRYTGRLATDPLGTMGFAETVAIAGSGTGICGGSNRWGDYAQTSMDPDGITFWYTGDYAVTGTRTRIYSFRLPTTPTGVDDIANQPAFTTFQSESMINLSASKLPSDEEMVVDLFDVTGKQINGKKVMPSGNAFQTTINVSGLSSGTYLIRVGNPNFQRVVKVFVK